jgi:hypothetical protein
MKRINKAKRAALIEANRAGWRAEFGIFGDGVHDDSAGLTRAIASTRSRTKMRQPILPGVYRVTEPIYIEGKQKKYVLRDIKFVLPPALYEASRDALLAAGAEEVIS